MTVTHKTGRQNSNWGCTTIVFLLFGSHRTQSASKLILCPIPMPCITHPQPQGTSAAYGCFVWATTLLSHSPCLFFSSFFFTLHNTTTMDICYIHSASERDIKWGVCMLSPLLGSTLGRQSVIKKSAKTYSRRYFLTCTLSLDIFRFFFFFFLTGAFPCSPWFIVHVMPCHVMSRL